MQSCNCCNYTGTIIEVDETVQKGIIEKWNNKYNFLEKVEKSDDEELEDSLSDEEFEKKLDELFKNK